MDKTQHDAKRNHGSELAFAEGFKARESNARSTSEKAEILDLSVRVEVVREGEGSPVAEATVTKAELSDLALPPLALESSVLISVPNAAKLEERAKAIALYLAVRRARMMGRANVLVRAEELSTLRDVLRLGQCAEGISGVGTQRVDLAAHYADQNLEKLGVSVRPQIRAQEIEEVTKAWLRGVGDWGFFKALHTRTLTRQQYVFALSNIYQFVRHTTRLVARAIAHSPTTEMRTHFIKHLNGEVNHELIIERDLAHMGEDVTYVRDHMAPNGPTQEFMAIQESMIGYYEDPVLLMASPVAAEGVTAHLDQAFADALHDNLRRWKVSAPEKASRFFISHMHTDGGDDGHWEMTMEFLSSCLTTESKHQFFLRSLRSAMRGTERLYDSFVTEMPSWAPVKRHDERSAAVSANA